MDAHVSTVLRAALLLAGLGASGSALAERSMFEALCQDKMDRFRPVVRSATSGYSIDHSQSVRQLSSMRGSVPAHAFVLGLTSVKASTEVHHASPVMRNPISHYECVSPRVTINLSYQPATIYIGREFARGSCAYQEILAHEMRHLNTYFNELPKVERSVRAAADRRFGGPPSYGPGGQATRALDRELADVWIPYLTRELTRVEKLQAAIDTPDEYLRLSKVCAGEVQSIIGPQR